MSPKINLHYDCLIIGFGLAGALLSHNLNKLGKNFLVIDSSDLNQASITGAGIINPLIGKKFNLSWNFQQQIKIAKKNYQEIESEIGQQVLYNLPILRIINSEQQLAAYTKLIESEHKDFAGEFIKKPENFHAPLGAFHTNNSYWLDTNALISQLKCQLQKENKLQKDIFDYSLIKLKTDLIQYKDISASQIIFCDGYSAIKNPLADFLKFRPARGEIIDLKIPELNDQIIYNFGNFILPLGNDVFRLGATYSWNQLEAEPILSNEHVLLSNLDNFLKLKYELLNIRAGIRPILTGRLPAVGRHPDFSNVSFINGLGSRGSLQAPYCAQQLTELLFKDQEPDTEIDIRRFYDKAN